MIILPSSRLDETATLGLKQYYRSRSIVALCENWRAHKIYSDYNNIIPIKNHIYRRFLGFRHQYPVCAPEQHVKLNAPSRDSYGYCRRGDRCDHCVLTVMLALKDRFRISPGPLIYKAGTCRATTGDFPEWSKFRSIDPGESEEKGTVKNDSRATGIGTGCAHVSLGFVAQLFNILKGETVFVGTKTERPFL